MEKFVNPDTIAKMQSDIKKKAGLNTNNTFKGKNDFEKAPTINGEEIATVTPDGTNYLMVYGVGTPAENAAELQAAYDFAKTMPRYLGEVSEGVVVSYYPGQTVYFNGPNEYIRVNTSFVGDLGVFDYEGLKTNGTLVVITEAQAKPVRTTVIVATGVYGFSNSFSINANGIDIVSLTGNRDITITHDVYVTADYVHLKGINTLSNRIQVTDNIANILVENCDSGADGFCAGNILAGTYVDCDGGLNSFAGDGGTILGTLIRCRLKEGTFPTPTVDGKIIDCIDETGEVINTIPVRASQFKGNTVTQPNGTQGTELASCKFVQDTLSKFFILAIQANLTNVVANGQMVYNSTDKKMYLSNGTTYTAYNVAERIYQINGGKYYKKYKGSFYQEEVEFATKANSALTGITSIQQLAVGIGNINPSGTISSITNGVVTGNGTKFTTEFYVGAKIYFPSVSGGAPQTISAITNDLTLTITNTSASVPPDSSYSGDLERALNVGYVILEFADNAAAVTGGLVNGDMYRTSDVLKVVHT